MNSTEAVSGTAPDSLMAIMEGNKNSLYIVDLLNSSFNDASDSGSVFFVDVVPSLVLHFCRFEPNWERSVLHLSDIWSLPSVQRLLTVNNSCTGSFVVDESLLYTASNCRFDDSIFLGNKATWIIGFGA
jgi:hypothetical protein